jgi:FMN phosphatase YigB (HAD superfamily)
LILPSSTPKLPAAEVTLVTKCIILDFDGTFTDVEREAAPFVDAFRAAVFDLIGRELPREWALHTAQIAESPGRYGWVHEGRIVAPASADPYIQTTTTAHLMFDAVGVLKDGKTRAAILQALYHHAYENTLTAFRPRAKEVLEALAASGIPTFVVTNARTDAAQKKLRTLGPVGLDKIEVHGDARKFVVGDPTATDERFSCVREQVLLPGLERPVFPRRGRYFDALAAIMQRVGAAPEEVLVCGDIYELDLSLPLELGMQVHMVTGPKPPAEHEIAWLEHFGARTSHADDLGVILTRIGR